MYETLLKLLVDLGGIQQHSRYHPEGDALYHSLQVFEHACAECDDWQLVMHGDRKVGNGHKPS